MFEVKNAPTVIVIHGMNDNNTGWVRDMACEIWDLHQGNINILSVEWAEYAKDWTRGFISASHIPEVANSAALQLALWYATAWNAGIPDVTPGSTHIIGHSHGAHVAGLLANKIRDLTGQQISRISALDASEEIVHLGASNPNQYGTGWGKWSASLVDFYKSSEIAGGESPWGHDNFLLAEGPGSWSSPFAAHSYAWQWYLQTITEPDSGLGYYWYPGAWEDLVNKLPGPGTNVNLPWKGIINGTENVIECITIGTDPSTYSGGQWQYPGPWPGSYSVDTYDDIDRMLDHLAACVELCIDPNTVSIPSNWQFYGSNDVSFPITNKADNSSIPWARRSLTQGTTQLGPIWNTIWLSEDTEFEPNTDMLLSKTAVPGLFDVGATLNNLIRVVLPREDQILVNGAAHHHRTNTTLSSHRR